MCPELKFQQCRSASLRSLNTKLHCFPDAPEGPGVLRLPTVFCGPRSPAEAAQRLSSSGFSPAHMYVRVLSVFLMHVVSGMLSTSKMWCE